MATHQARDSALTIRSPHDRAPTRRLIRRQLRTPLSGLAWSIGVNTGDMVIGWVIGSRLRARLIPRDTW
jgi:hypothetical protein